MCSLHGNVEEMKKTSNDTLVHFDDARREQAQERYEAIRPFLEDGVPLPHLSELQGRSLRTLRYWVAAFREDNLLGLVPKPRSDSGRHRLKEELRTLIEGVALCPPKRPTTLVHTEVVAEARRKGFRPPSYRQVLAIVNDIPDSLMSMAHEDTKTHKQKYDLLIRFEAQAANERWQVDHKHLDVWLEDGKGKAKKPWLTVVEDDHSRAIAGYYLHFEAPSAQCVAIALRHAILADGDPRWSVCGIPDIFYSDNGPDFTSNRIEQVAAQLGMELVFSIPEQPRGRGKIERFFETLEQMFLPSLPGFLPGGRPPEDQPLLSLDSCNLRLKQWLLDVYHERVHRGTGQKPVERWEADGFVPRMLESSEHLDLLLNTVADTRRVQREGISFKGHYYSDLTLAAFIGEDVVIRYDPSDAGEVRVYHGGEFICKAVCFELVGGSFTQKEVRKANSANRKRLRAELRNYEATSEEFLAARNGESADGSYSREQVGQEETKDKDPEYEALKGYEEE